MDVTPMKPDSAKATKEDAQEPTTVAEWVPRGPSVLAADEAAKDLADIVFRGERIRNEQPIR